MNEAYNFDDFADFMPSHDEHFDQYTYVNALWLGYSDGEALQLVSTGSPDGNKYTGTNYRYPDPELFSEPVTEDTSSIRADRIATNSSEHDPDLRDSHLNDTSYETSTLTAGIGASHAETGVGERQMQGQEHNHTMTQEPSSTPQLTATSSTSAWTTSFRTTPDQDVRQLATATTLPDTYAGRRSAQGRSQFPRECGACGKRFLYEDSAQRHYRKHHGEPINIISRWDAPKRPPPGIPRNLKAARSRARRSGYPPTSAVSTPSVARSDRDHTSMSLSPSSIWTDKVSESPTFTSISSIDSTLARLSDNAGKVINPLPNFRSNDIATQVVLQYPILQPAIDPEISMDPELANNAQFQSSSRPVPERIGPTISPEDARHAAIRTRQTLREALPDTAHEAIARANPHLMSRYVARSDVVNERSSAGDDDGVGENIRWLRTMANRGEYPPLPPDWAYDVGDRSLTWHAEFGKYFRRDVNGKWQSWCQNKNWWEEK